MIVWFSGTGNSRFAAEQIAAATGDSMVDAAGYLRHGIAAELIDGRPWVFVTPTYAWRLPRVMEQFIRTGSFSGSSDAYFVMTCGGEIGAAAPYLQKLCSEVGLTFRGVQGVVMPENYITLFEAPDEAAAEGMIEESIPVLQQIGTLIRDGKDLPTAPITAGDRLKSRIINPIFYRFGITAKPFWVKENCGGCTKCAEVCPLGNIEMVDGKPVWGKNCTQCMACICRCPQQAIEYGKMTATKRRYVCPR